MNKRIRAVGLVRISTDLKNQPYGLEAQKRSIERFCEFHEIDLVEIVEEQVSGAAAVRPGVDRVRELGRAGAVDALVVYRVDRLSRSIRGLEEITEELAGLKVDLMSTTEDINTSTPTGRLFLQLLGILAEFERATLIDRICSGLQVMAAKGRFVGGPAPFGYRVEQRELFVDEVEAPVVERVFAEFVDHRRGAKAISDLLNESGYRTRKGGAWTPQAILKMLRRVTYVGKIKHRDEVHEGHHAPIVDAEKFERAQQILAEHSSPSRRRENGKYLLSGVISCAVCDGPLTGATATGRNRTHTYYQCARAAKGLCRGVRVPQPTIDEAVTDALINAYCDSEVFEEVIAKAAVLRAALPGNARQDRAALQTRLRNIQRIQDKYLKSFEMGDIQPAYTGERLQELEEEAVALRQQLAAIDAAIDSDDSPRAEGTDWRALASTCLRGGSTASKKAFARAAIARCAVHSGGLTLTLRVPASHPNLQTQVREPTTLVELEGIEPSSIRH